MPQLLNTLGSALKEVPNALGYMNQSLQEGMMRRQDPAAYAKIQGQRQEQASQEQYALAARIILNGLTEYGDVQKAMQDPEVQQAMSLFVQNPQKMKALQAYLDVYKPKKDTKSEMSNLRSAIGEAGKRGIDYPVTEENRELLGQMGFNPLMQTQTQSEAGMFPQGMMSGDVGARQTVISPPPQKPGTPRYVRDATGKYVPVTEGVMGYTKPTTPEKPLRQLVQDTNGNWVEVKAGSKTTPKPASTSFQNNLAVAAQIAGIDPKKVAAGTLTQQEAEKLADVYKKKFGAINLLQAILSGGLSQQPTIQYDTQGNRVQ